MSIREVERTLHSFVRWLIGAKPKCGRFYYFLRFSIDPALSRRLQEMRRLARSGICPFCGARMRKLANHMIRMHRFEIIELLEKCIGKKLR